MDTLSIMRARSVVAHERARLYMPPYPGFSVPGFRVFQHREELFFPVNSLLVIK
jgi:hypothetical protein